MAVHFPTVTEDGKIETLPFLQACRSLKNVFDALGTTLLVVKKDLLGNVEKLIKVYQDSKEKYKYINDLVLSEKEDPYLFAIDALLWLKRSLELVKCINEGFVAECEKENPSNSLNDIAVGAYTKHLRRHHNWLVQNVFEVCISFFPTRLEFLEAVKTFLCDKDANQDTVLDATKLFIFKMDANLSVINSLFLEWNLEALVEMDS